MLATFRFDRSRCASVAPICTFNDAIGTFGFKLTSMCSASERPPTNGMKLGAVERVLI